MSFTPGKPKTGRRQPGTPNRLTGAFREAVLHVYRGLGGHTAFLAWARENQTEYYKIAARLIPAEMREDGSGKVVTVVIAPCSQPVLDVKPIVSGESGGE